MRTKEVDVDFEAKVANKFISLRSSAHCRGLEFGLALSDIKAIMKRKTCYYTGVPFGQEFGGLSFERIDSNIGYVRGNVVACSERVNQLKANLPVDAIIKMANKLQELKDNNAV